MKPLPTEYKQTQSADDSGFQYERKMTILLALRLFNSTDEFCLANNYEKGGKFDDLAFKARRGDQWNSCFIQLKHKQEELLPKKTITLGAFKQSSKGKTDFQLKKYLESFVAIVKKFYSGDKDAIFDTGFESSAFFIYTNALLHGEVLSRCQNRVDVDFLSTNKDQEINFRFDPEKDGDLFLNCNAEEQYCKSEFMNRVIFCSGQASVSKLDGLIDQEVHRAGNFSDVEVKYIAGQLKDFFSCWQTSGKYLNTTDVKEIISKTSLETQSEKREDSNIKFNNAFLKCYQSNFQKAVGSPILFTCKADNCLMAFAALKQLGLFDSPNILLSLRKLEQSDIQQRILSQNVRHIVVDCESDHLGVDVKQVVEFISILNTLKPECLIILVVSTNNSSLLSGLASLNAKKQTFNCTLINLDEQSKSLLLQNSVYFQGYTTPLKFIFSGTRVLEDVFDMAAMSDLLKGRDLHVGIQPVERIPYYITRVLVRSTIDSNIFSRSPDDLILAVTGISHENAGKFIPISPNYIATAAQIIKAKSISNAKVIVMESGNSSELYTALKNIVPNLHWIDLKGSKMWRWVQSSGNFRQILRYISHVPEYVNPESIMAIENKIVVISAEPGMGKSTMLTHLAAETKRLSPHMWVVTVSLNDFTDNLADPTYFRDIESSVKRIVAKAAGVSGESKKFDARLFNYCYDVSGNMAILLDGFDEITPYYTKQGIMLMNVLQRTKVSRIWITTRPVMRRLLQDELSLLAYTIRSFGASDQENFFKKYWLELIPDMKPDDLIKFIKVVMQLITNSFDESLNVFTGIPLQTRMIAEVFYPELKSYHETGVISLPRAINGLTLFETFVEKKLEILLGEKSKISSNASARQVQKRVVDAHENFLMQLALLTVLPVETCASLSPPIVASDIKNLKKRVSEGEENAGIVLSFKSESPQFIHRTFAEFYVAKFFSRYFEGNVKFLSSEEFFASSFNFVRYFFDRMLAGERPLHRAALERDLTAISAAVKSKVDINAKDEGGRTALHVAAILPESEDVIRLLVKAGADVSVRDAVLQWLPIEYAIMSKSLCNIGPLFDRSSYHLVKDIVPNTCESLNMALKGDYLPLLLFLFENNIVDVIGIDELPAFSWKDCASSEGFTLLHLAAVYNAVTILQYLLRRDHRDSRIWQKDRKDKLGRTPLLLAVANNNTESAKQLLSVDAELPDGVNDSQDLPLYAVATHNDELFQLLVQTAKDRKLPVSWFIGALSSLVVSSNPWAVMVLLALLNEFPSLIESKTKKGLPILIAASMKGNVNAVRVLCSKGINLNQKHNERTALHVAVIGECHEIVDILLKSSNIDINAKDALGASALYIAAMAGSWRLFDSLVKRGADVRCVTNNGNNLTHAVGLSGNREIFEFLMENKFDFCVKNEDGLTGMSLLESLAPDLVVRLKKNTKTLGVYTKNIESSAPLTQPVAAKQKKKKNQPLQTDSSSILDFLKNKMGEDNANELFRHLKDNFSNLNMSNEPTNRAQGQPKKKKNKAPGNPVPTCNPSNTQKKKQTQPNTAVKVNQVSQKKETLKSTSINPVFSSPPPPLLSHPTGKIGASPQLFPFKPSNPGNTSNFSFGNLPSGNGVPSRNMPNLFSGNGGPSGKTPNFSFGNPVAAPPGNMPNFDSGKAASSKNKPNFTFGNPAAAPPGNMPNFDSGKAASSKNKPNFTFGNPAAAPPGNKPNFSFGNHPGPNQMQSEKIPPLLPPKEKPKRQRPKKSPKPQASPTDFFKM